MKRFHFFTTKQRKQQQRISLSFNINISLKRYQAYVTSSTLNERVLGIIKSTTKSLIQKSYAIISLHDFEKIAQQQQNGEYKDESDETKQRKKEEEKTALNAIFKRIEGNEEWKRITKCAKRSPPNEDDDPTSFALQIFSNNNNDNNDNINNDDDNDEEMKKVKENNITRRRINRVTCFGSASMIDQIGDMLRREGEEKRSENEEKEILSDNKRIHLDVSLLAAFDDLVSLTNSSADMILSHLLCQVGSISPPSSSSLLSPSTKKVDIDISRWQNETIVNFFTNRKTGMYEHTDLSYLTFLYIPSLWSLSPLNQENERRKINGLQILHEPPFHPSEVWVNAEQLLFDLQFTNIETKDNEDDDKEMVESKILSPYMIIMVGSHLEKFLRLNYNIQVRALSHRISSNRHADRISFGHFYLRTPLSSNCNDDDDDDIKYKYK